MVSVDLASGIEATDYKHKEERERPSDKTGRPATPHITHERSRDSDDHHDKRADPRREEASLRRAKARLPEYDGRIVKQAVNAAVLLHCENETSENRATPDRCGKSILESVQRLLDAVKKRQVGRMLESCHRLPEQLFLLLGRNSLSVI